VNKFVDYSDASSYIEFLSALVFWFKKFFGGTMEITVTEKFIEKLGVEVYPVTIIKFLLNKKRILSYFSKATDKDFELSESTLKLNTETCEYCKEKQEQGLLCRNHTSIQRVLSANKVAFDLDTNTFFYKNEIFRMVGKKLVVVYCPHPKLINDSITDAKIRKVSPITVSDDLLAFPEFKNKSEFLSTVLLNQNMKCWFNKDFSLITIPESRNYSNFCLVPNN
jgi:hypothetical protein